MRQSKYDKDTVIIKRGDVTDNIFFLKEGVIEIEVPYYDHPIHFGYLNPGSVFCAYTSFS